MRIRRLLKLKKRWHKATFIILFFHQEIQYFDLISEGTAAREVWEPLNYTIKIYPSQRLPQTRDRQLGGAPFESVSSDNNLCSK